MNSKRRWILYAPYKRSFIVLFAMLTALTIALVLFGVTGNAFETMFLGHEVVGVLLLLASSLLGSYVNIPVHQVTTRRPIVQAEEVNVYGISRRIPAIAYESGTTLITVNLGGAVIPALISVYLIAMFPSSLPYAIIATLLVAGVTKLVTRTVPGVGMLAPALVPPLNAALAASLLGVAPHIVAYVAGSMGTLIGVDLLNFGAIPDVGSPIVSIGGAGTFDAVFLSGIAAVILAV
jgi:uncharacterized membrane protein